MKLLLSVIFLVCVNALCAQKALTDRYFDVNYTVGNIALHNNNILHLITNRPQGVILGFNKKTFGDKAWQQRYNYPDYGLSYIYQNFNNSVLGENHGIYGHYNFYMLKRRVIFRIGQGIAYATNPYDKLNNPKNVAFGSHILSSTYVMLNYKKPFLIGRFGVQAGLSLIHYSNANIKAPNTSTNSLGVNLGVNYNINTDKPFVYSDSVNSTFTEPIKFNVAFRFGLNESDLVGSGQFPFYIVSAYADKRLGHKSAIQFGADVFFSTFLKEHIKFRSIAYPEDGISGNEDYKRIGLFAGHELFINKMSVITQLGYYVYYPVEFEGRFYIRAGLKRYFGSKFFGAVTLKSHGAKAEAVEFGVGVRL